MASTTIEFEQALIALQAFQVAFLWIHDWIPLGPFNDVSAVRGEDTLRRLVTVTLVQSVPYSIGLFFSVWYYGQFYPDWLDMWLWISYSLLLLGAIRAWWVPYLLKPEPERAERYRKLFGNTHSFLPERNGMVPNTIHVLLHLCTAATLVILYFGKF